MALKRRAAKDRREFYAKLFSALEYGQQKAEEGLLAELLQQFGHEGDSGDIATWFAERHPPENVMGWLLRATEPFARMLEQIYTWLSDVRATAGGNVQEVDFDFEALRERVPFRLDTFPKSYVQMWVDRLASSQGFDPRARGHLRVDTPNYWRDNVPALRNLSYAPVLHPSVFDKLPGPNKFLIASRVARVAATLRRQYARKTPPLGLKHWQFSNFEVLYVKDERDWDLALRLAREPGSDGGMINPKAKELYDVFERGLEVGAMVQGKYIEELLTHASAYILDESVREPRLVLGDDRSGDDTYAFLCAYELCFPAREVSVRELSDVVDRVFLPFWKHRWRLFEVWSILWLRDVIPERYRPHPYLVPREDAENTFAWVLSGGDSTSPVATIHLNDGTLSIWFQLKTPLSPDAAARYGQQHIEPDIRLRKEASGEVADLVLLELKDRHLARGSEEKRIARMYATTDAPVVCVANYSPFSAKGLHRQNYIEKIGMTRIFIVDDFKPGETPQEVAEAIRASVEGRQPLDLLIDVSGSMRNQSVGRQLEELAAHGFSFSRWFKWSSTCEEMSEPTEDTELAGGSTDLEEAIECHARLSKARAVILTDDDGCHQFARLLAEGTVQPGRYLCLDVQETLNGDELQKWLER